MTLYWSFVEKEFRSNRQMNCLFSNLSNLAMILSNSVYCSSMEMIFWKS